MENYDKIKIKIKSRDQGGNSFKISASLNIDVSDFVRVPVRSSVSSNHKCF